MQICKVKNYQELSRKAANLIAAQIILKPDSILGLATGSSPVGTYEHLVEMYENGDLDFSQVTTVNLDEYKGLAGSDEQSYRYFMNTHLFHKININHANTYVPNGTEPDAEKACQARPGHKAAHRDCSILDILNSMRHLCRRKVHGESQWKTGLEDSGGKDGQKGKA